MNFAKRAGLYIIRHKQKTLILFLVLLIVSAFFITGIAIKNAVIEAAADLRRSIGGKITIDDGGVLADLNIGSIVNDALFSESDNDSNNNDGFPHIKTKSIDGKNDNDYLTFDILEVIVKLPGVKDYNIISERHYMASPVNFNFLPGYFNFGDGMPSIIPLLSVTNSERMDGFANGNLKLESGRHLTADDYRAILISDELAEYNELKIGDTLEICVEQFESIPGTTLNFEIVGILSGTRGKEGFMNMGVPSNQLIIDMATIISESQRMASYGNDDPERLPGSLSVFVADPLDIDKVFERIVNLPEVYGKGFSITMGTEGFEEILASLKTMQGLVFTLIVIIAVVSMVILAILLTIWSRERVKEIGIFLSSGIKKIEIITQFIVEALLIAVVAFAISLPISQVVANGVGHFIITQFADAEELKNDVDEQASENSSKADGLIKLIEIKDDLLNGPAPIIENPIDQIFVAVHAHYLMWVYLIGLPVVIGSVLIACLSIVRLKPKQILSKMS